MYRQIATRRQTTEVRSDNVATVQVHHYDPELRAHVLLSYVCQDPRCQSNVVCDASRRSRVQDTRRVAPSVPRFEPDLGQGVPWKANMRAPPRGMTGHLRTSSLGWWQSGVEIWRLWTCGTHKHDFEKEKGKKTEVFAKGKTDSTT